jgi:hypothetical protein
LIMNKNGLISTIVHPDYIQKSREQDTYRALLTHLVQLRKERCLWITTPAEVDLWWRQRAELRLVENGSSWKIEGEGRERARIAYATEENGELHLTF